MTYPELLKDYMVMQLMDNPKKLAQILAVEPQIFDTEGVEKEPANMEELQKFAEEAKSEELKQLDDILDSL
jgi:hypothetical protein